MQQSLHLPTPTKHLPRPNQPPTNLCNITESKQTLLAAGESRRPKTPTQRSKDPHQGNPRAARSSIPLGRRRPRSEAPPRCEGGRSRGGGGRGRRRRGGDGGDAGSTSWEHLGWAGSQTARASLPFSSSSGGRKTCAQQLKKERECVKPTGRVF